MNKLSLEYRKIRALTQGGEQEIVKQVDPKLYASMMNQAEWLAKSLKVGKRHHKL